MVTIAVSTVTRATFAIHHLQGRVRTGLRDFISELLVMTPTGVSHATEAQREPSDDAAHQQTNQYSSFHISS
jgi:hypothetical protein